MNTRNALILIWLIVPQTSCSFSRRDNNRTNTTFSDIEWQSVCESRAAAINASETWCLSSTNPLEDAGQYFIFLHVGKKTSATIDSVARGASKRLIEEFKYEKHISSSKEVDAASLTRLVTTLRAAEKLKDFDSKTFDGTVFTFRHLKRGSDGRPTEAFKMEMNSPEQDQVNGKKYTDLINAIAAAAKK